jgi:hypothetical protein
MKHRNFPEYDSENWEVVAKDRLNKLINFNTIHNKKDYYDQMKLALMREDDKWGRFNGRNIINSKRPGRRYHNIIDIIWRSANTQKQIIGEQKRIQEFLIQEEHIPRKTRITNKDISLIGKGIQVNIFTGRTYKQYRNLKTGKFTKNPFKKHL